jgi:hypothetical protein
MRLLREFMRSRRGNIALLMAIIAGPLCALVLGGMQLQKTAAQTKIIQAELDNAALSGAQAFIVLNGESSSAISREVETRVARQQTILRGLSPEFSALTLEGTVNLDAKRVTVVARGHIPAELLALVGIRSFEISRSSVAEAQLYSAPVCILALERAATAIRFVGAGEMKAKDCVVWSNSKGSQSIAFNGRGKVSTERLCTVGRAGAPGLFKVDPVAEESCTPVKDPMVGWNSPIVAECTEVGDDWKRATTLQLDPGVYCGGLRVEGKNVFLRSGVYVIKDGPLILHGEAKIVGKGVAFLLTGAAARVEIDGDAKLELSSPESGPMAGIVIGADRRTIGDAQSSITGRTDLKIGGVIYLPTHHLSYWGESDTRAASPVTTVIARSIDIGGSAYLEVRNDKNKARYAPVLETGQGSVRLVQ